MRPRWHNDHRTLAAVARHLHAQRAAHYRRLVWDRQLSRTKALDGLRVMRTIARTWRAIADLQPEPFGVDCPDTGGVWPFERVAHLTIAARHARAAADAAPADYQIVGFADAIDTLLWWESQQPSARFLADATLALRAQAGAERAARPTPQSNHYTMGVAA